MCTFADICDFNASGRHAIILRVDNDAWRPPDSVLATELTVMSAEFPLATRLPGTGHTA
jgi:hypothetical protein